MTAGPRELLTRLFEYIGEQIKEVDPRGFQLSRLQSFRCHQPDVQGLPGIELDMPAAGDYLWLRVPRLEAQPPPKPSEQFAKVIRVAVDPTGAPPSLDEAALKHAVLQASENADPEKTDQFESDLHQAAQRALEAYTRLWRSWAEGERPRRKTIRLYSDLFALKHQLQSEETARPIELVWGIGVATWQMRYEGATFPFEYPILTQSVEVTIDANTMALEIRPRATESRAELDAFVECSVPGAAAAEVSVREDIARHKDRPISPFDPGSYSGLLKLIATNLDSKGSFVALSGSQYPAAGSHLVVSDAWVLFSRPRANNFLVEDLKRLRKNIEAGDPIPEGPLSLVSAPLDEPFVADAISFRGVSSRGGDSGGSAPEELYFPLPYNTEQQTIVQRLERSPGVTVQGPPGTGKTHTIANIICHYLATGKRVLVTSRGEQALKELRKKIPEEIQPLTVALLTDEREGMRQFQGSVEAIQHQLSQLDSAQVANAIVTLRSSIDLAHRELARLDARVDEIALAQLSDVVVDGETMRPQKLAELIVSGRAEFGWFDDDLTLDSRHAPPLTASEGAALVNARRTLSGDLAYVHARLPSADDLPAPEALAQLHRTLCCVAEIDREEQAGRLTRLKSGNSPEVLNSTNELLIIVVDIKTIFVELETLGASWPLELRHQVAQRSFSSELEAALALLNELPALIDSRAQFLKRPVEFPPSGLRDPKVREAVARATETGKPFGVFALGVSTAKAHVETIKVSGLAPQSTDDWSHVSRYLDLHDVVTSFAARWNHLADSIALPHLEGSVPALRNIEMAGVATRSVCKLALELDAAFAAKAKEVFAEPWAAPRFSNLSELEDFHTQLSKHLLRAELAYGFESLKSLKEKVRGRTGAVTEALRTFLRDVLGNLSIEAARLIDEYTELIAELRRIHGLGAELATVRDLSKRVRGAGATRWSQRLCESPAAASGSDAVIPGRWREAWNWARMKGHLDQVEARDELVGLWKRQRELENALARMYRDLVSKAAWLATKRNASPKVLQALAGYAIAIRRIGQGTGPNAIRYRRDARESMQDAAGAVPCWIMSHAKISESMPPTIGAFDLVIVDEASQSDLWALPAVVRGKKILVVGDDKQVSPDGGFMDSERIAELRSRFLRDQPYGIEMTPEKSLYELAARVFSASQIMLREHFRCVPPIIAYSNRTFYRDAILPLRIPRASERIDPPLVDILVEDGRRETKDTNPVEAEAIAEEISAILKDDRLANRTIGVVSLLGHAQAKLIDSIVRARLPASELIRRDFSCGDARAFQGAERDIMFLSLVVDPLDCKAVSGNMFDQRFNVAASRARDRMYLVRSVSMNNLSEKDLRRTLLSHFDKPLSMNVEKTRELEELCESHFERDVYQHLVRRGFRVIPQVKAGTFRIDMVVEGAGDLRLAIECDGDDYHGPDRWRQDTTRQRILERAGWTFWRCFASTWTLKKEVVFAELLQQLSAMGIEPVGSVNEIPSLVEHRVWKSSRNDRATRDAEPVLEAASSRVT